MERPELRLVTGEPARAASPGAAAIGAALLAAAALATLCGADAARRPFAAASLAESALAKTLAEGDPRPTLEATAKLGARLRDTPLDSASRTIAASLAAETASGSADRDAAVRQAQDAIRLNPSNEGVARGAARVLARCGRTDLALREIAGIFLYAPDHGAAALADIEPFVAVLSLESGLPATADAWFAWSQRLRSAGRVAEADVRLASLLERWPNDLAALSTAASVAAGSGRLDDLARLVPQELALPETLEAAQLHAYRAQSKAATGDAAGARADAALAVSLSRDDPWVLILAGDVLVATEPSSARDYWTRALHLLLARPLRRDEAIWVRTRLARLDDREGRAGDALRGFRSILAERPDDGEAKRRIAELTGEVPR